MNPFERWTIGRVATEAIFFSDVSEFWSVAKRQVNNPLITLTSLLSERKERKNEEPVKC